MRKEWALAALCALAATEPARCDPMGDLERDLDALEAKSVREVEEQVRAQDKALARETFLRAKQQYLQRSFARARQLCEEALALSPADEEIRELHKLANERTARAPREGAGEAVEEAIPSWKRDYAAASAKVVRCDFRNEPLGKVLRFLEAQCGIAIAIDPRVKGAESEPVTASGETTLASFLRETVSGKLGYSYAATPKGVLVSDRKGIEEATSEVRLYAVGDLLEALNRTQFSAGPMGIVGGRRGLGIEFTPWIDHPDGYRIGGFAHGRLYQGARRRDGGLHLGFAQDEEDPEEEGEGGLRLRRDFGGGTLLEREGVLDEEDLAALIRELFPELGD